MRQLQLDGLIRTALQADERVRFALAYGSFTQGTGDVFSDVEYYAFTSQELDAVLWLEKALDSSEFRILHHVVNEFGTLNVTVTGLIRVELHVQPVQNMPDILNWPNEHIDPERMLIKDAGGELRALLNKLASKPQSNPADEAQLVFDRALNWVVFGWNVLKRGEKARASELLRWIQSSLLRFARIENEQTTHWLNPYRLAEKELPAKVMTRFATLTGGLHDLEACYRAAWIWLVEFALALNLHLNPDFQRELTATLAE